MFFLLYSRGRAQAKAAQLHREVFLAWHQISRFIVRQFVYWWKTKKLEVRTIKILGCRWINPDNDKEMQHRSIGGNSWSRVAGFNGYHILDLLLADNEKDIEVYTDRNVYLREYS